MLQAFFQNFSQKPLPKYKRQVIKINSLETHFKRFSNSELKAKTSDLKKRLINGEPKTSIIPEAFALVREASRRVLGLRHFDVQLIGGLVLEEGKVAEMQTGEGKTLVAMLPTFLNSLYGKGTHVITVNDYLAKRDANYVGHVHSFLGLTVGLIQEEMEVTEKKKNYECDVVYVTNSALGFDYLSDNMAYDFKDVVQGPLFFCVIDEVDSILIDEARTPLIISGPGGTSNEKYFQTAKLANALKQAIHYKTDEKNQNVTLTNTGIIFCEQALNVQNLYNPDEPWIFYILNSLKAKELFEKNKDYISNENKEILIVDEFTGRTMPSRRWSNGLHQAMEAKENVPIQNELKTLTSISYQNLFLVYEQLSGMTGTAKTEEAEFENIYNLKVVSIPTNLPVKRKDLSDLIYKTQYIKWRCIAKDCIETNTLGCPVLIGTTTIEKSELLAALLSEYKIPYRLLNALPENVESESEIVAQAGCNKAITIATNMAGRGTDILLGGNLTFLTKKKLNELFLEKEPTERLQIILNLGLEPKNSVLVAKSIGYWMINEEMQEKYFQFLRLPLSALETKTDPATLLFLKMYNVIFIKQEQVVEESRQKIINLGGLHVIGTERHESRRIDNQLRGRAGRQGDPGSSRFFLCFEDKLIRIFGGAKLLSLMRQFGFSEDTPIQSSLLNRSLESAQRKVEAFYFETRKQLFDYDQTLNLQRNTLYAERKKLFEQRSVREWFLKCAKQYLRDSYNPINSSKSIAIKKFFKVKSQNLFVTPFPTNVPDIKTNIQFFQYLQQQIEIAYDLRELELKLVDLTIIRALEKVLILQEIDNAWAAHLQKISFLRDSIRWLAYGQKDPLSEYKKEAFNYFNLMLAQTRQRIVDFMLSSKIIIE